MDAMTMVFKAGDGVNVGDVKPGDKVRFRAEKINGQITVTQVEKVK
jgi:Cu/Ag efflux protein CusF